jgi:predicted phosphoribosyltransferase
MRDQAIYNTHSNALYIKAEIAYDKNEIPVDLDEAKVQTEVDRLQAEHNAQEYARDRKEEYDALNQFELISDDTINGTSTHKDAIEAIKAKYPKPQ